MLEPHEVFFWCFHLLEPGSGELGIHIQVVAAFEQNQRNFEVADLGEIGREQIRKQIRTLILASGAVALVGMSNVLSEEKRQQVLALERLGWPLRRIEHETGVRRETASAYLKTVGIGARPPGVWDGGSWQNRANR